MLESDTVQDVSTMGSGSSGIKRNYSKKQRQADSAVQIMQKGKDILSKKDELLTPKKIYSNKKLKAICDSLGIGRMDTLLALASLKNEMPKEELLDKINSSFLPKGAGPQDLNKSLSDLSGSKLKNEALRELPPLSGFQLKSKYLQTADSILQRNLKKIDDKNAEKARITDSINVLKEAHQKKIDSLQQHYQGNRHKMDSVMLVFQNTELPSQRDLMQAGIDSIGRIRSTLDSIDLQNKLTDPADSLSEKYREKREKLDMTISKGREKIEEEFSNREDKFKVMQKNITNDFSKIVIGEKKTFLSKFYFEGIVSTQKYGGKGDEIHFSPAIGYEITHDFSVGVGPNIIIRKDERSASLQAGFRTFAKYQIFDQRAYLQVEDRVDPVYAGENQPIQRQHNILAGGGILIPLSKSLALNASLLYRVNNSVGVPLGSPWIFRIGVSTIKDKKVKK